MLEESGILGFGIRNTAQRIRNFSKYWNQESKFHRQRLESSTWNLESAVWNPESKTVLDSFSSDERVISDMISVLFFERASCFTNVFVPVSRKNKVFSFLEKVTEQSLLR